VLRGRLTKTLKDIYFRKIIKVCWDKRKPEMKIDGVVKSPIYYALYIKFFT